MTQSIHPTPDLARTIRTLNKARKPWLEVIARMEAFAAAEGLACELRNPGTPEYQIVRLTGEGVRLIVYPHTTRSTGNQHARVRTENSTDLVRAAELMGRMILTVKNNRLPA